MIRHLVLAATMISAPCLASGQHQHVHGEGKINAVIEGGKITLTLELPMDVAVGFERAPKSNKEKAALVDAEKTLKNAANLFLPSAAAKCSVSTVHVEIPALNGKNHSDIDTEYVFSCGEPDALKEIETTIFKSFKRLYRLEAQRMGPTGKVTQRLTPKTPILNW